MDNTQIQELLDNIKRYAQIQRKVEERNEDALSLNTINGSRVGKKKHIGLERGYYFVAIEEINTPVYAFGEDSFGKVTCIRLDKHFSKWCNNLKKWLKV